MPGGSRGLQHRPGRALDQSGWIPVASTGHSNGRIRAELTGTGKDWDMPRTYVSLIQADYGRSGHGNFEAVLVQGEKLWHWFRDNSRNDFGSWARGPRVTGERDIVSGPGPAASSNPTTASDHTANSKSSYPYGTLTAPSNYATSSATTATPAYPGPADHASPANATT